MGGGALVSLEAVSRWRVASLPDGRQVLNGCVAVSGTDQAAIAADSAGFYVNVHNATFPAGAVRAQLDPETLVFLFADLDGDQEVPGPGDPNGFGGTWAIAIDPDEDIIYAAKAVVIDAILANPDGYYLNVHNAEFPAGAVRGQLFNPFGPPPM